MADHETSRHTVSSKDKMLLGPMKLQLQSIPPQTARQPQELPGRQPGESESESDHRSSGANATILRRPAAQQAATKRFQNLVRRNACFIDAAKPASAHRPSKRVSKTHKATFTQRWPNPTGAAAARALHVPGSTSRQPFQGTSHNWTRSRCARSARPNWRSRSQPLRGSGGR